MQVQHEKELATCPPCFPTNETLILQLKSENEEYAHKHNSCMDSLQTKTEALEAEARKFENEKQTYETLILQLKSENEENAHKHNSCMDLLQKILKMS